MRPREDLESTASWSRCRLGFHRGSAAFVGFHLSTLVLSRVVSFGVVSSLSSRRRWWPFSAVMLMIAGSFKLALLSFSLHFISLCHFVASSLRRQVSASKAGLVEASFLVGIISFRARRLS